MKKIIFLALICLTFTAVAHAEKMLSRDATIMDGAKIPVKFGPMEINQHAENSSNYKSFYLVNKWESSFVGNANCRLYLLASKNRESEDGNLVFEGPIEMTLQKVTLDHCRNSVRSAKKRICSSRFLLRGWTPIGPLVLTCIALQGDKVHLVRNVTIATLEGILKEVGVDEDEIRFMP